MACRLPGADNLEQFWQLLSSGGSAVGELPHDRLDQELYYDPRKGQRGKTYSKLGAIISSRQFDRQACPIPDRLEHGVDNAHLLMCETAAAACRHAGLDPVQSAAAQHGRLHRPCPGEQSGRRLHLRHVHRGSGAVSSRGPRVSAVAGRRIRKRSSASWSTPFAARCRSGPPTRPTSRPTWWPARSRRRLA